MIGLAALSSQPALAARVSAAILLVPVAFTAHMSSLPFLALTRARLDVALAAAGLGEWASHKPGFVHHAQRACAWAPRACALYLTAVTGANPRGNLDPGTLVALMGHFPAGTSVKNMAHWAQGIRRRSASGLLRFDHGTDCAGGRACNQAMYGQPQPPAYNLTAITTPLAIFTGTPPRPRASLRRLHGACWTWGQAHARAAAAVAPNPHPPKPPCPATPTTPSSVRPPRRP
jgi:hypothetical protein